MDAVFSTGYWLPVACFSVFRAGDTCIIEQYEHYQKQTNRTRCSICGANGPQTLVVPVMRKHGEKNLIKDVMLDLSIDWQRVHWLAIVSAYSSSPYFEYYQDDIRPFYEITGPISLFDYNREILACCFRLLEMDVKISETESYMKSYSGYDYREITPVYEPKPYYQVFARKHGFVPGQSILDLILNEGPEAWKYLESETKPDGKQNLQIG
jgi:hypothetical protein